MEKKRKKEEKEEKEENSFWSRVLLFVCVCVSGEKKERDLFIYEKIYHNPFFV